jgi:hypothetical protein
MRNVITLSDVPKDLHDWLKLEAARRSKKANKRIGIYQVVSQAIKELKVRIEAPQVTSPIFKLFSKKVGPAELKRGCLCVPESQRYLFGTGNIMTIRDIDDFSTLLIEVQSQGRLNMRSYYKRHKNIIAGDEILFEREADGMIGVIIL